MKLIEQVYRFLPLGTLVNNKVLVVHGGLSDTTDLELIKSLDRTKVNFFLQRNSFDGLVNKKVLLYLRLN